jgi:hypothetical protein
MSRILLCHPKQNWGDAEITHAIDVLSSATGAEVVSGRAAYKQYYAASGRNWNRWIERMGRGTNLDGSPLFDVYVVPGLECARATAQITEHALAVGRDVLAWCESADRPFRRVARIENSRPNDQFFGWRLVLA